MFLDAFKKNTSRAAAPPPPSARVVTGNRHVTPGSDAKPAPAAAASSSIGWGSLVLSLIHI